MPDSNTLRQELIDLLRRHLNRSSFTPIDIPSNGGLPLNIPAIQIEAWTKPEYAESVKWDLAVESALVLRKVPVLAHKKAEGWCFRMPLYMLNPDYELSLDVERHHSFEHTVEMSVKAFALVLRDYQENVAAREGWMKMLESAIEEAQSDTGRVSQ